MSRFLNTVCKICSSSRTRTRPFGYQFNGRWLQAWDCLDCKIIFIDPQPTEVELQQLYSEEYFHGDYRCGHEGTYFDDTTLHRLSNPELLRAIKLHQPKGRFLEVGCAGGAFLNAAHQEGYETHGVEYSSDAAQFARAKFGLRVITGDLQSAQFDNGMFDIVYLGDVLEHLPDPRGTLRELHRIMVDDGLLVIECPTQTNTLFSRIGFLMYGLLRKNATVQLPPYHLFEYRPTSLSTLLNRTGFRITKKKENIIRPREIRLRGSTLQKIGKKFSQYPNYVITQTFGTLGDRIQVFARKQETSTL